MKNENNKIKKLRTKQLVYVANRHILHYANKIKSKKIKDVGLISKYGAGYIPYLMHKYHIKYDIKYSDIISEISGYKYTFIIYSLKTLIKTYYDYGRRTGDYSDLYSFCEGLSFDELADIITLISNPYDDVDDITCVDESLIRKIHFPCIEETYDSVTVDEGNEAIETLINNTLEYQGQILEETGTIYNNKAKRNDLAYLSYREIISYILGHERFISRRAQADYSDFFVYCLENSVADYNKTKESENTLERKKQ